MAFLDLEKAYDSVPQKLIWKILNGRVLDELSQRIQGSIPWCLIFADDIVLVSESQDELNIRLEQWRNALEQNGLRISRLKSEYLRCDYGRIEDHNDIVDIRIGDQVLHPHDSFRYLGSMLHKSGMIDEDVSHRIRVGWLKWRAAKGVLENLKVENIVNKMREGRLRWFGHVRRRPPTAPVRRVEALTVSGVRRRGRPTRRLEERLKLDMKELLLTEDMTSNRILWRSRIRIDD
ncbi:uncharacterized protein [Rutidosis leptorrhynchoides]|uniref:uncharacterized protein n=1 Tax=Rutidosis leptorrhynchoides TaxID=125765 RepID=UPI003A991176